MDWYFRVWKKFAEFGGRARRSEFWYFFLFNFIINVVLRVVGNIIGTTAPGSLYSLAVLIPSLAVGARRMHDTGRSGWWMLINLVPVIGWIVFLVLAAQEGEQKANAFGENPKGSLTA